MPDSNSFTRSQPWGMCNEHKPWKGESVLPPFQGYVLRA